MGDVHRLPSTDDAERQASAWFARMKADDVTADVAQPAGKFCE